MKKKFTESRHRFYDLFKYFPSLPPDFDYDQDQDEYADLLDKCVADNFDYTIELYGTEPVIPEPYDPYAWIID